MFQQTRLSAVLKKRGRRQLYSDVWCVNIDKFHILWSPDHEGHVDNMAFLVTQLWVAVQSSHCTIFSTHRPGQPTHAKLVHRREVRGRWKKLKDEQPRRNGIKNDELWKKKHAVTRTTNLATVIIHLFTEWRVASSSGQELYYGNY